VRHTGGVGYGVLATATMVLHFAVLAYLVVGGFLAWRWRWSIVPHVAMAAWGLSSVAFGLNCPLTYVEDWARRSAGEASLTTGFIDHYLTNVIYPGRYVSVVQAIVAAVVLASWVGVARHWRRPGRATAPTSVDA